MRDESNEYWKEIPWKAALAANTQSGDGRDNS